MRIIYLLLLWAVVSTPAYAAGKVIKFEGVQEACVQVGDITIGPDGKWKNCRVTRGRWLGTIDFLDLYQAQYCLGKDAAACDKRALVIFGNHAYSPDAEAMLVRLDDGAMEYDDPLLVMIGDALVMGVSAHTPDGDIKKSYYLWRTDRWISMDAQAWQQGLSAKLPAGASVRQEAWPDLETMNVQANLFLPGDADCCPSGGKANIELGIANERFVVNQVNVDQVRQSP